MLVYVLNFLLHVVDLSLRKSLLVFHIDKDFLDGLDLSVFDIRAVVDTGTEQSVSLH